jgi:hypothetical protein
MKKILFTLILVALIFSAKSNRFTVLFTQAESAFSIGNDTIANDIILLREIKQLSTNTNVDNI